VSITSDPLDALEQKVADEGLGTPVLSDRGVAVLAALFYLSRDGSSGSGSFAFGVGNPKAGEPAPPMRLASTAGGVFELGSMRGRTVALYFQEGIMCQPCWDQLKDIEKNFDQFRSLGVDSIVSITHDPLDALKQKVADESLSTPLLSDPGVAVSKTYEANLFGMMGTSTNGHSFVVVGPDGIIKWRADYGGPPNHYMYVPINILLEHMRKGLQAT
ncbi:MAG: peroxiredoxin family protein, partial [Actinomycetota bacterium]